MRDVKSRRAGQDSIGGRLETVEGQGANRVDADHSNRRNARRGAVVTVEDLAKVSRLIDEIERESGEAI